MPLLLIYALCAGFMISMYFYSPVLITFAVLLNMLTHYMITMVAYDKNKRWRYNLKELDAVDIFPPASSFSIVARSTYFPDNVFSEVKLEWYPSGYWRKRSMAFVEFINKRFWIDYHSLRGQDMDDALDQEYCILDHDMETNFINYVRFCKLYDAGHYRTNLRQAISMGHMFNRYFFEDITRGIRNKTKRFEYISDMLFILDEELESCKYFELEWVAR